MRGERKAKALGLKREMKALATGMRDETSVIEERKALRVEGETISLRVRSAVIKVMMLISILRSPLLLKSSKHLL